MPKSKRAKKLKKETKTKSVALLPPNAPVQHMHVPRGLGIATAYAPSFPKTYATISSYSDQKAGLKGASIIRYGGPILIADTTVAAGVTNSWGYYNSLGSVANIGILTAGLEVNPYSLIPHGSSAQAALGFARFMYRKLRLTWVGLINTSTNGAYSMQYTPDGAAQASDFPDFSDAAESQCHMFTQGWNSSTLDVTPFLNTKDMYYTDVTSGIPNDAIWRQTFQGIVTMKPNPTVLAQTVALNWGLLYVEAELVVAEQTQFRQNVSVTSPAQLRKAPKEKNVGVSLDDEEVLVVLPRAQAKRSESKSRS